MATNEVPLSDLISSVEQVGGPEISPEDLGEKPKNQKSKTFPIIVGILLVLILVVGGYYVYTNYIKEQEVVPQEELTPEETPDLGYGDVFIELSNGKIIYVKVPTSDCDTTGYEITEQESEELTIWEDNQEGLCSSSNILQYFVDEETMTGYYSNNQAEYPLEKYTEDSIVYEYILKPEYVEGDMSVSGLVYQKDPTISVKGYDAFRILSFIKGSPEVNADGELVGNILEGASINTNCVFDLGNIIDGGNGYIVFSGSGDVWSSTDYCEILSNSDDFVIEEGGN